MIMCTRSEQTTFLALFLGLFGFELAFCMIIIIYKKLKIDFFIYSLVEMTSPSY